MQHTLDVQLRLHIDESEIGPRESPRETAERLLREIMTVDDRVLDVRVFSWTWTSRPITGS
jgi:hypothetical protein